MNIHEFKSEVKNGKIFTVEFVKRTTGETRVMNCRLGVQKNLVGVGHKFNPSEKNLLCVFDMQKESYRFISLENLISLKLNGKKYIWKDEKFNII